MSAQLLIRKFAVFTFVSFFFTDASSASHGSLARSLSRRVFQCDRNPKKGATQHGRRHNVNKPAQNLKKKHQKLYLFKSTDQNSGQEISLKTA